jgi:FkbM family methyltransferase
MWDFPMKQWLRNRTLSLAEWLIIRGRVDLLALYYKHNGILQYENPIVSGEDFFIRNVLKSILPKNSSTLFDVGASDGDFSALLLESVPHAHIFAFEPNPVTFRQLSQRFSSNPTVKTMGVGLGDVPGELDLYDYSTDAGSAHASLYADVLTSIHHCAAATRIKVQIKTLDSILSENGIDHLHFLKIDTEGNDFAVLKGGNSLVSQEKIDMIQFEFNEMNVISRVFLRDFYNLLPNYMMFRLSETGLIPLGEYDARHEVFKFQNIVAARRDVAADWVPRFCKI